MYVNNPFPLKSGFKTHFTDADKPSHSSPARVLSANGISNASKHDHKTKAYSFTCVKKLNFA